MRRSFQAMRNAYSAVVPVIIDIAQFCLSLFDLLLTRIVPLLAIVCAAVFLCIVEPLAATWRPKPKRITTPQHHREAGATRQGEVCYEYTTVQQVYRTAALLTPTKVLEEACQSGHVVQPKSTHEIMQREPQVTGAAAACASNRPRQLDVETLPSVPLPCSVTSPSFPWMGGNPNVVQPEAQSPNAPSAVDLTPKLDMESPGASVQVPSVLPPSFSRVRRNVELMTGVRRHGSHDGSTKVSFKWEHCKATFKRRFQTSGRT